MSGNGARTTPAPAALLGLPRALPLVADDNARRPRPSAGSETEAPGAGRIANRSNANIVMKATQPIPKTEPATARAPSLPMRVLGWGILSMSLGLVSCQSMFFL
jgi:hypothetical protein